MRRHSPYRSACSAALDISGAWDTDFSLVFIPYYLPRCRGARIAGALENHFLASARGELYFALLADGTDADAAVIRPMPRFIAAGQQGIEHLNESTYGGRAGPIVCACAGTRLWNPGQC